MGIEDGTSTQLHIPETITKEIRLRIPGTDLLTLDGVGWVGEFERKTAEKFIKDNQVPLGGQFASNCFYKYADVMAALTSTKE